MNGQESAREALRAQANREELAERIARALPHDGKFEPLKGLHLARVASPTKGLSGVFQPSFCVIAQGRKEVFLGDRLYRYDPFHYLITTVALPFISQVLEASKDRPYLSLRLTLDPAVVSAVVVEAGPAAPPRHEVRAIDVSTLSVDLLDAVVWLVRLLDAPAEAPILAPLIKREIVYRLSTGEQGLRLRHIAVLGGHRHRIARAVKRLQDDFDQTIPIERLAEEIGMSTSSFHHHFKAVTGMSPLMFQKQLQLQEARRLMLSEEMDAATASYHVGYNTPSHFSRAYKRLFGAPPMRDVERLRETVKERAR